MQAMIDIQSDSVAVSLRARLKELRMERGEKARALYRMRYGQWLEAVAQAAKHHRSRYSPEPVILDSHGEAVSGRVWNRSNTLHGIGALPRGEQVRRDYAMRSNQWAEAWRGGWRPAPIILDAHGYRVDGKDSFRSYPGRRVEGPGLGLVDGTFVMVLSPALPTDAARALIAKAMSPRVRNAGKKPTRKRIPTVSRKQAAERVAKAIANGDCIAVKAAA